MESYQEEIALIKKVLKDNPKGMTVTDVSRKININRNSVAKYLDIMRISGLAEMITFGPAKVFFPVRRIPLSSMLNFTSDCILVFDKDLRIVMINDMFLSFMNMQRDAIIGQFIGNVMFPMFDDNDDLLSDVKEALDGNEFTRDTSFEMGGDDIYCRVRVIPTTFEDGRHGVTIIVKNNTEQKMAEKTLRESEEKFRYLLKKINKK